MIQYIYDDFKLEKKLFLSLAYAEIFANFTEVNIGPLSAPVNTIAGIDFHN